MYFRSSLKVEQTGLMGTNGWGQKKTGVKDDPSNRRNEVCVLQDGKTIGQTS